MTHREEVIKLVSRFQADVWRYLRVLGANAHEAEDLAQEVFIEVLQRPFEQREDQQTLAYLRKAARSRLLMLRRRQRTGPNFSELEGVDAAWEEVASEDGGQEAVAVLRDCLALLEPRQRAAIEMRFSDGAKRLELAGALSVSEEGAKSLMRRVMEKLRECMQRRIGT